MWLLHARSHALKYVTDSKDFSHAYAILSHTWEDEEYSFQELSSGTGKDKKGWLKVSNACKQALKDGWEYIWIDTVCINKDSSAELSEAINSMWQWYCDAQVCYAYLSDVSNKCPELKDRKLGEGNAYIDWSTASLFPEVLVTGISASDDESVSEIEPGLYRRGEPDLWHRSFARSRWFTRGWTLQELIAPEPVIFFNRGWKQIATKNAILQLLWKITKIDPLALESRTSLPNFVVARKMSWARGRHTTRIEDRSYSLLGIMGVNMPLLYGEGEQAFARLQEEIIKTSTDHSILAWDEFPTREHMSGEALDILFASSPDQFASGSRMVRWAGDAVDLPFRVTNRGVSFDGLLITGTGPEFFAALNCRFEDDLRGTLALRLRQKDDVTSRYRSREMISRNDFWIADDRRLTIYNGFDASTPRQSVRQISLLHHHPAWQLVSKAGFSRTPKFWVKFGSMNADDYKIVDAWPAELWNLSTGVMVPQSRKSVTSLQQIIGSVKIQQGRSGHKVSIAFESPAQLRSAHDIQRVEEFARDGIFRLAISTVGQQHARSVLESCGLSMEAHEDTCATSGLINLSVRVSEVAEILNDLVCVLEVSALDQSAASTRKFPYKALSNVGKAATRTSKSRERKSDPQLSRFNNIPIININGRLS